ncbi:hypothetical protein L9F63_011449, partial [Diploptera punctata]
GNREKQLSAKKFTCQIIQLQNGFHYLNTLFFSYNVGSNIIDQLCLSPMLSLLFLAFTTQLLNIFIFLLQRMKTILLALVIMSALIVVSGQEGCPEINPVVQCGHSNPSLTSSIFLYTWIIFHRPLKCFLQGTLLRMAEGWPSSIHIYLLYLKNFIFLIFISSRWLKIDLYGLVTRTTAENSIDKLGKDNLYRHAVTLMQTVVPLCNPLFRIFQLNPNLRDINFFIIQHINPISPKDLIFGQYLQVKNEKIHNPTSLYNPKSLFICYTVGTSIASMLLLFDGLVDCTLYLPSDWSA